MRTGRLDTVLRFTLDLTVRFLTIRFVTLRDDLDFTVRFLTLRFATLRTDLDFTVRFLTRVRFTLDFTVRFLTLRFATLRVDLDFTVRFLTCVRANTLASYNKDFVSYEIWHVRLVSSVLLELLHIIVNGYSADILTVIQTCIIQKTMVNLGSPPCSPKFHQYGMPNAASL